MSCQGSSFVPVPAIGASLEREPAGIDLLDRGATVLRTVRRSSRYARHRHRRRRPDERPAVIATVLDVAVSDEPWLVIVATLGPLVAALAAIGALIVGIQTVRQRTAADAQAQWWARVQWAAGLAFEADESKRSVGFDALALLASSPLAGPDDAAFLAGLSFDVLRAVQERGRRRRRGLRARRRRGVRPTVRRAAGGGGDAVRGRPRRSCAWWPTAAGGARRPRGSPGWRRRARRAPDRADAWRDPCRADRSRKTLTDLSVLTRDTNRVPFVLAGNKCPVRGANGGASSRAGTRLATCPVRREVPPCTLVGRAPHVPDAGGRRRCSPPRSPSRSSPSSRPPPRRRQRPSTSARTRSCSTPASRSSRSRPRSTPSRRSRSPRTSARAGTRCCSSPARTARPSSRCGSRSATSPRSPVWARTRATSSSTARSRSTTSASRCPRVRPANCLALVNFWRSLSNLTIQYAAGDADGCRSSANFWAVSQAAPMRRVNVTGANVSLMDYCTAGPQYASGGFIADSTLPFVVSGSQQQFLVRNGSVAGWSNSVWNQVFAGVQGAPGHRLQSRGRRAQVHDARHDAGLQGEAVPLPRRRGEVQRVRPVGAEGLRRSHVGRRAARPASRSR